MPSPSVFANLVNSSTPFAMPASETLGDISLLQLQRDLAEIRRRVDAWSASIASQIAHRSRRELGHEGLAQRHGARTPELLVQRLTGGTSREAHTMVRVGTLITDASALDVVGAAVAGGHLSLDAADVIRAGLDSVDASVPSATITGAAESLVLEAPSLTVEKLATRAREFGAVLDEQHVIDRERAMRDARFLRVSLQADGMTRLSGMLDPESAAAVVAVFDGITSPRRGGPRFVDPAAVDYSQRLARDARTTEQLTVDAFVQLLRIGAAAAPDVVGAQHPAVRVLVTDHDLSRRAGSGQIEGQRSPISLATVEREICDRGTVTVRFDSSGHALDVGRTQRLFTPRQRIALAIRDGGCRFLDCDRPPSWCEAHHISSWIEGGRTDVANGILLCRHHHLLLHDKGWQITSAGADSLLVPPASIDPQQRPIPMPPKSTLVARMLAAV